jgi:peptidoglycan/xylan/chitin deacetylase (PgdA/CDA1 family)
MSHWLDPLHEALDQQGEPVTFFFRDDDAGWYDDRLFLLLDLFARFDVPLDVAVIPQALTPRLARELRVRIETYSERLGLHQHGFAHINHELEGRKCEFGQARNRPQQEQDIASGKRRLAEAFGSLIQPIFTPPWNRCTTLTGDCLVRLGFQALSRDSSARPLNIPGFLEMPVQVDWFAKHKGERLNLSQLGILIAEAVKGSGPIGIMFHHALMGEDERDRAGELFALLATHHQTQCRLMQSLLTEQSVV